MASAGNPELDAHPLEILRREGAQRVAPAAWAYLMASAGDGRSARRARRSYEDAVLVPSLCRDTSGVSTRTTLVGHSVEHPVVVAPMASHRLFHPEGEHGTAAGVDRTQSVLTLSMESSTEWQDVRVEHAWCQVSPQADLGVMKTLIEHAQAAGARALVVTLDTPVAGARHRQRRAMPEVPTGIRRPMLSALPEESWGKFTWAGFDWDYVRRLVDAADIPVIGKGVLRPADAERAVAAGLQGVIVSNHGGRNLDATPAPLHQLPEIARVVAGRATVLVDGGVRSGSDVLVALAHGADGVLVGRPVLWGLAARGADGVATVLDTVVTELRQAMSLCGVPSITDVDQSLLTGVEGRET